MCLTHICWLHHASSTYKLFAKKGSKKRKMKWNQYCVRDWLLWPRLSGGLWQMKADGWKKTQHSTVEFLSLLLHATELFFYLSSISLLDHGMVALFHLTACCQEYAMVNDNEWQVLYFHSELIKGSPPKRGFFLVFDTEDIWISKIICPNIQSIMQYWFLKQ